MSITPPKERLIFQNCGRERRESLEDRAPPETAECGRTRGDGRNASPSHRDPGDALRTIKAPGGLLINSKLGSGSLHQPHP
ncbi:unnamed protein product [Lota lota]